MNELSQETFINATQDVLGSKELAPGYGSACRLAATEGIVLLKNEQLLPINSETSVAVFGRCQVDYFYVGYGSGGDVKAPYRINLMDGIRQNGSFQVNEELASLYQDWCQNHQPDNGSWGNWPTHYPEMPLAEETVKSAASKSDMALVVIGRSAGEDRESLLEEGSYYLTTAEKELLDQVTGNFEKVAVILDCGNTMDLAWMEAYGDKIQALVYAWQGGMESGNALADVLSGKVSPSGKLTSTIARHYEDYPSSENFGGEKFNNYAEDIYVGYRYFETFAKEKVLYPFGFGLSYTTFEWETSYDATDSEIQVTAKVTNTGQVPGKEVVQVYVEAPQGVLGKPARSLAAYGKTEVLNPGESQTLALTFSWASLASYDDSGATGHKSAYVLEAGDYGIHVGNDVRSASLVGNVQISELEVVAQLQEAAAVQNPFQRLKAQREGSSFIPSYEPVPVRTINLKDRILENLPEAIEPTGKSYHFEDVLKGAITLEQFVSGLSVEELKALCQGDYVMDSKLGPKGNAGVFGGILPSLRDKGVKPITTTDGPSGVRLQYYTALLPCGTALASTWNLPLLKELATHQGKELHDKGSHILLAPGMNIMRDPLCGRNFEYFSEDPLVTGKSGAAIVSGLQTFGTSACPKHFACNNQERFRNINDSRVSERALREIYLKGFEICVKEANPHNIMTSYNKINGVWGHYHYDLCTTILRQEWGYTGNVVTDWWMRPSQDPDFPDLANCAYRVRAQVDVLMPGSISHNTSEGDDSLLASYGAKDGITLGELQRTAINVLTFVKKAS